jgi:hypothetical protein
MISVRTSPTVLTENPVAAAMSFGRMRGVAIGVRHVPSCPGRAGTGAGQMSPNRLPCKRRSASGEVGAHRGGPFVRTRLIAEDEIE